MKFLENRIPLLLILLLAMVLRGGLIWQSDPAAWRTPDSLEYVELAEELPAGHFERNGQPEIFRVPGYPLFVLASDPAFLLVKLHGKPVEGIEPVLVFAWQIALDVMLVALTYLLGAFLVSRRVGLLAALLQAISPLVVASPCRILSDSLYAFLFAVAVLMMVRHLRGGGWRPLIAAAVTLSLACYVRPVGGIMVLVFLLALMFQPGRLRRGLVFAGVAVAIIGPWVVRNAVRADYYGFSSVAGDSMYYSTAAEIEARRQNIPTADMRLRFRQLNQAERQKHPDWTAGQLARRRQTQAAKIISDNSGMYAKIYLRGAVGFWLPGAGDVLELLGISQGRRGTVDVLQREGIIAAVKHYFGGNIAAIAIAVPLVLILLIKYLGVAVCVLAKVRWRMPAEAWLILLIVAVSAIAPGPGLPRYRLPIEPLFSVAAAVGLFAIVSRIRKRGK
ncbi:MAG: glycosyltransferase family 39 protein [Phycisphaerae bacterium]|nr:glycosyltransferase family 39 protein [Phycisphaerae bacterium]